jgi:hypothetical protein
LALSVDDPQSLIGVVTDRDIAAGFEAMGNGAAIFALVEPISEARTSDRSNMRSTNPKFLIDISSVMVSSCVKNVRGLVSTKIAKPAECVAAPV